MGDAKLSPNARPFVPQAQQEVIAAAPAPSGGNSSTPHEKACAPRGLFTVLQGVLQSVQGGLGRFKSVVFTACSRAFQVACRVL